MTLLEKIEKREAGIAVIGMGYVGLPLAVEFAKEGYCVIGVDVSQPKVDMLNRGESYIPDVPTELIADLAEKGLLSATTDYSVIRDVDAISICVPTPLRKTKDPDMSYVIAAADEVAKYAHDDLLVVLESTTYPGTTDELIIPRIAHNGFVVGQDVYICFSPERIDPGNKVYGVRNTPKIIGGATPNCVMMGQALYGKIIDTVVPVSSTRSAEMVKLLENTFRSVNIALVNEVALMCDKLGVNVWEVIDAASTKPFGFMTHYPGPGLGGHCIPIDPLYLSWKMKTLNYTARFIELATEVNSSMPIYVVDKVIDALNDARKPVNGSKILVLGVAYKPNIDDSRESPAIDVIGLLQERGGEVTYHDPHIESLLHEGVDMESSPLTKEALHEADAVVIVTNHAAFDYAWIGEHAAIVVDSRNAMKDVENPKARVVGL
ncbi:MAG: nucleotide sugar dehydrogenase [Anaerolineae bacterium]